MAGRSGVIARVQMRVPGVAGGVFKLFRLRKWRKRSFPQRFFAWMIMFEIFNCNIVAIIEI